MQNRSKSKMAAIDILATHACIAAIPVPFFSFVFLCVLCAFALGGKS